MNRRRAVVCVVIVAGLTAVMELLGYLEADPHGVTVRGGRHSWSVCWWQGFAVGTNGQVSNFWCAPYCVHSVAPPRAR